jgi:hypothetical protein
MTPSATVKDELKRSYYKNDVPLIWEKGKRAFIIYPYKKGSESTLIY